MSGDDGGKNKRIAVIATSSLILVAMVVAVTVGVSYNKNSSKASEGVKADNGDVKASMKSIQAICQPTDYRKTCVDSLSKVSGTTTNPQELIQLAMKITVQHINDAIKNSQTIKTLSTDPRSKQALANCRELMNYAIHDIEHSFQQLGALDVSKIDDLLQDLKIWLSAAVTYQETCLDGFQNTTGNAGENMKKFLKSSGELTSNALAMVNEITSLLTSLNLPIFNRRLLSVEPVVPNVDNEGIPDWVASTKRRLLQASPAQLKPDAVVAQDGSGQYKTIGEALAKVPKMNNKTFVIYIKEGVYKESVMVERAMTHVMFVGDGQTKTKITGNKNFVDGTPTFKTATVSIVGDDFIARDIGFENSAGAEKHQAVALRVQSDRSAFYRCQMDGYQDTLYTHTHRQFYRDCTISGTIDFVFGDAASLFQNCKFVLRKPLDNQQNIVTASGRKDRHEATAIIIQGGSITADPELVPFKKDLPSYLARPWKEYSRAIFMQVEIDDVIDPKGWLPWMGTFGINTCFYAEYNNTGPGAAMDKRVQWRGIKKITPQHAMDFTPRVFLAGNTWIPGTGVPYVPGMLP